MEFDSAELDSRSSSPFSSSKSYRSSVSSDVDASAYCSPDSSLVDDQSLPMGKTPCQVGGFLSFVTANLHVLVRFVLRLLRYRYWFAIIYVQALWLY